MKERATPENMAMLTQGLDDRIDAYATNHKIFRSVFFAEAGVNIERYRGALSRLQMFGYANIRRADYEAILAQLERKPKDAGSLAKNKPCIYRDKSGKVYKYGPDDRRKVKEAYKTIGSYARTGRALSISCDAVRRICKEEPIEWY